jgi:hypothetical protein
MAWWGWLLIWGVLVLALLGILALFAVRLFRKVVGVFHSLGDLASTADVLDTADDGHGAEAPPIALLQKRSVVVARRDLERERFEDRRAARHSRRIDRARTLIGVDANSRKWF